MKSTSKAVSLISGGLDSMLATKVIMDQGIHVEGINFYTGFCHSGHTAAIRQQKNKQKRNDALWVAEQLGIQLHIIDIVEEYKQVLTAPKHGYGQFMNPCLDCKIFMIRKAKQWMVENNFDFIITGEVVGQRPKSQLKRLMPVIAENSGADDRLLRPLCAKNLEPSLPELRGWVDREKLFGFSGRSRKPQMQLAQQLSIDEYAQPAGGCCVLTDESYSRKLQDLWRVRGDKNYSMDDIILLKVGRHLRPAPNYKLIIGREEGENNFLEGYRKQFIHLRCKSHLGPLTLIDGDPSKDDINFAARICARFCDVAPDDMATIQVENHAEITAPLIIKPLTVDEIERDWYV